MLIGLGIDLVEISRVEASYARFGDRLVHKLMGPAEAAALPVAPLPRARSLALAIAAKEAASKAIGTGWSRGVHWRDVVLEHDPEPCLRLEARAAEVAERLGASGPARLRLEVRGNLVIGEVLLLG